MRVKNQNFLSRNYSTLKYFENIEKLTENYHSKSNEISAVQRCFIENHGDIATWRNEFFSADQG